MHHCPFHSHPMHENLLEQGKHFSITVTERSEGRRLDQFLSEANLKLSRSRAKNLIEKRLISLNHKPAKPSAHVRSGDIVSGSLPQPEAPSLHAESLPLHILYEDASLIVVDKAPGMVVHPAQGNPSGTLANALLYHFKNLPDNYGALRPGIVHRLDKDTSGVMVVAKEDEAFHSLIKQFKNRTVKKVYSAIVYGRMTQEEGFIHSAVGRHPTQRKRMSTRTRKGREAITRWKKGEEFDHCTLLEVFPQTGRTHQIRVHLSSIGHPILGDRLYGRKGRPGAIRDPVLKQCANRINRQALHAQRLEFFHPRTGERMEFVSPIPRDMEEVLECLRLKKMV